MIRIPENEIVNRSNQSEGQKYYKGTTHWVDNKGIRTTGVLKMHKAT